jgi:hypothetical protein
MSYKFYSFYCQIFSLIHTKKQIHMHLFFNLFHWMWKTRLINIQFFSSLSKLPFFAITTAYFISWIFIFYYLFINLIKNQKNYKICTFSPPYKTSLNRYLTHFIVSFAYIFLLFTLLSKHKCSSKPSKPRFEINK